MNQEFSCILFHLSFKIKRIITDSKSDILGEIHNLPHLGVLTILIILFIFSWTTAIFKSRQQQVYIINLGWSWTGKFTQALMESGEQQTHTYTWRGSKCFRNFADKHKHWDLRVMRCCLWVMILFTLEVVFSSFFSSSGKYSLTPGW